MAEWLRRIAESLATWVRFPLDAESFFSPCAILHGTESVSALTRALFILLDNIFLLGFRQWLSRADRVLTLNM